MKSQTPKPLPAYDSDSLVDRPSGEASSGDQQERRRSQQRITLRLLFAAVVVWLAGVASGQDALTTLQFDGPNRVGCECVLACGWTLGGAGDGVSWWRPTEVGLDATGSDSLGELRLAYADMNAYLANFDSDADPDGWVAAIVLRDQQDRPALLPARATFELRPRLPSPLAGRFIEPGVVPIRWSMPLKFDADGVARFKLPLRQSQQAVLGWKSRQFPSTRVYPSSREYRSTRDPWNRDLYPSQSRRRRTFVAVPVRDVIGIPNVGQLRVHVSVPGQGEFDSEVLVQIRPPVLVDTPWPYR